MITAKRTVQFLSKEKYFLQPLYGYHPTSILLVITYKYCMSIHIAFPSVSIIEFREFLRPFIPEPQTIIIGSKAVATFFKNIRMRVEEEKYAVILCFHC